MDSFISLAKQGYQAYEDSQSQQSSGFRKTGGEEYNSSDNSPPGSRRTNINQDEAVSNAQRHGSNGSSELYQGAFNHIGNNSHQHQEPIDEDEVTNAHRAAYQEGGASNLSAGSLGGAAALQTLKKFTSGGNSGGASQTDLISMAMAEATKLFDQSGGAASGSKQDAVNGAAMTVMKLLVQSKFSSIVGGGNSGGLSGLMGMASHFM